MSVSAHLYDNVFNALHAKDVDLTGDSFYVMLCTSSYTPNQGTHAFKSDVTNEVSGTGYTANGALLASVTYTLTTHVWTWTAGNTTWTTTTLTARYAVIYDRTPATDAARRLVGYVDFGGDQTTSSADFVINWNASGIFTITVS